MGKSLEPRVLHPLLQQRVESIIKSCRNPAQLKTAGDWLRRLRINSTQRFLLVTVLNTQWSTFRDKNYGTGLCN